MQVREARFHDAEQAYWRSVGVVPMERMVPLGDGGSVRVQEVGSGAPVVFVHGSAVCGSTWGRLIAELPDLHCIALDRPGCGLSPAPHADLTTVPAYARFADDLLVRLLDGLGLDRATIVSTSFGGYFALRTAAAHPDRVRGVCHLAWTMGAPVGTTPMVMRIAALGPLRKLMASVKVPRRATVPMLKNIGLREAVESGKIGPEFQRLFRSVMNDTDTMRNELTNTPPIVGLRGANDLLLFDDAFLAGIDVPTAFLWGENDPNGGADVARSFTSRIPDATLELVPDSGHAPWLDDPDRAGTFVREFVARVA